MAMPATLEVCKKDLFTAEETLRQSYDNITVQRVLRIREMYTWKLQEPEAPDRRFIEEVMGRHGISQSAAYSDLAVIKQLLPLLSSASRDFHRWRANEMALDTYRMAKLRKDTKTMAQITKTYAEINRVSLEDEQVIPYDDIVPQMFTATDDPSVLGIKPIPNIAAKIKQMIEKYKAESIDIEDVECEECDLEENTLFPDDTKAT